ncbi:heat shock factor 2-binding protein isoform X2 [Conger conger]|uniref:heat shock factor 2-binding protein isoform X2 n=1 Tax=Conger conger TaxID=82655 RepID=UPI002A59B074|nr:heat shock factor 2-binding protein isoform X2 [Conger conger]
MSLKEDYVRVRKRDLERLTTEVMQLREFLPKVLNGDLIELLHKARGAETMKASSEQEQDQLRQECQHLRSRLHAAQSQAEGEREAKLGPFLAVAGQTLESFVKSLGEEVKMEQRDLCSHDNQFVLALAGVITNIAAVTCGRDFLATSAPVLLDTLTQLLGLMMPGACAKLKVLMLMALYNVSISVKGLQYISEGPGLLPLICCLLEDGDWEVCLHVLRLLQSLVLEGAGLTPAQRERLPLARIRQLSSSPHAALRQAARDTLEDLHLPTAAPQGPENTQRPLQERPPHGRTEGPWHSTNT